MPGRRKIKNTCVCLAAILTASLTYGSDERPPAAGYGSIRGVVTDAASRPIATATVAIHRLEGASDRVVISGSDGAFSAENLTPGVYRITVAKEGMASPLATTLEVPVNETVHPAIVFSAVPALRPRTAAIQLELAAMKARIEELEAELQAPESEAAAVPPAVATVSTAALTAPAAPVAVPPVAPSSNAASALTAAPSATSSNALPVPVAAPRPGAAAQQVLPAPAPAAAPPVDKVTPFADHDWTWLNGNPRTTQPAFDTKFFTPDIRADITYAYDFNRPKDDSMGGSSELFRSDEIQLEQLGIGGDFHWDNVRARFMTQFGMYSETTPRNDASPALGQWNLADAYRYISEGYGGYHLDLLHGINIDAGIFMSYIGLFSYYNFDNWAYQPSYVSSNTPWFFNGLRIQVFPTNHLKIEPWLINGWQSYGSANGRKGVGGQIKWTPAGWINIVSNEYGLGQDDLYIPGRKRLHTDNSVEVKYFDRPSKALDKMAFTFTGDLGCEYGSGVSCHGDTRNGPKQSFVGFMVYNRWWFDRDLFAFTLGGGKINNPGRYLVLLPPINGETAASAALNSPYFTENPGDPFKAWDVSGTYDYMPRQWLTFRFEGDFRHANVPYFSGSGGLTPPPGTNNGYPTEWACMNGAPSLTIAGCAGNGGLWTPNLQKREFLIDIDILVKF